MQHAQFGPLGQAINGIDGFYSTSMEFAGGRWNLEIGYRLVSTGTRRTERMTADGLEVDMGEAPTVRIVTLEVGNDIDHIFLPRWLLNGAQESQLESEIVSHLEDLWYGA